MARYFLALNGATVVGKQEYAGDDSKADALIAQFISAHPILTVQEVDAATFDAAVVVAPQTQAQALWAGLAFQSTQTVGSITQAIHALAKYMGLE